MRDLPAGARFEVESRYKTAGSIFEKLFLRRKDSADDVLGLRVILEDDCQGTFGEDEACVANCYRAASIATSLWPNAVRTKDYAAHPKPNGYRSVHMRAELAGGAMLELQVRTRCMQEEATQGRAAHAAYKATVIGGI